MTGDDEEQRPATPRQKRQVRSFGWLLFVLSLVPVGLGGWGAWNGWQTLSWPRADARIVDVKLNPHLTRPSEIAARRVRQAERERATIDVAYVYTAAGSERFGTEIEAYTFGMQNSAAARRQREQYRFGTIAQVAYDPANPDVAYLEPGPSSVSLLFLGAGGFILLCALLVLRAGRLGIGRMEE
jgi:hypothetical protein